MKSLNQSILALVVLSIAGCGQPLVDFHNQDSGGSANDLAKPDLAVTHDLSVAMSTDLAGADLTASVDDLSGFDADVLDDAGQPQAFKVIAVRPLALALVVPTFIAPTATFNKAVNPTTINALTFTLREQGTQQLLAGSITYLASNFTATFKPINELLVDTTYVATITTGVIATNGEMLATSFVWTFTTASQACRMEPLVLGTAGNFGAFAGVSITNIGATIVNGDIGVSPGSSIIGFGASPGLLGPGIVTGTQRLPPDPAAAQAMTDLTTAYTDASTRSLCFATIADGELGGKTITPGLYRSGISSFGITGSDLTLDGQGDPDALFVFQTSTSTLTVADGRSVILIGRAQAANVFWSVGTSATIGTTAAFKGTILADQSITLMTGASLEGRALARAAAVTLASNIITMPITP